MGTYWYHSHYSTQYCDGLRGAIVIYDPEDPFGEFYDVDDGTVILISRCTYLLICLNQRARSLLWLIGTIISPLRSSRAWAMLREFLQLIYRSAC